MNREQANLVKLSKGIEALKRQRNRMGRLISIFRTQQAILDNWTTQYSELSSLKLVYGLKPFSLPPKERKLLKRHLSSQKMKELEEYSNAAYAMIQKTSSKGSVLVISEMENTLHEMDAIIVDLMTNMKQIKERRTSSVLKTSGILIKVNRIFLGVSVIAIDVHFQSWASVLSGMVLMMPLPK